MNLDTRISRRTTFGLAASAVAALAIGRVSAQDSTPAASPAADLPWPAGPLGEHAQWFLETLNGQPGSLTLDQINSHFAPVFFETTPMSTIYKELSDFQASDVIWEVDPTSVISTMDMPTTVTRFILIGDDGSEMEVAMTLDRESELLASLVYGPVGSLGATPEASPAS